MFWRRCGLIVQDGCKCVNGCLLEWFETGLQATLRFGAASVYFVRFGSGEAGRLGISCSGAGVWSCWAIVLYLSRSGCGPRSARVHGRTRL